VHVQHREFPFTPRNSAGEGRAEKIMRNEKIGAEIAPILKRFPLPILDRDVLPMWRLTPVLPEPAADPTDVKRIKAAVGIPRQTSSPRTPPNSPTERRRARQSGQNQEAGSSVLRWRRGAARQAGTHGNRVARPIFQTARPLQRLVGELVDEDLFFSQVESETVDVHGIDLFGSPAAPATQQAEVLFV
jgi:hypothetical protein